MWTEGIWEIIKAVSLHFDRCIGLWINELMSIIERVHLRLIYIIYIWLCTMVLTKIKYGKDELKIVNWAIKVTWNPLTWHFLDEFKLKFATYSWYIINLLYNSSSSRRHPTNHLAVLCCKVRSGRDTSRSLFDPEWLIGQTLLLQFYMLFIFPHIYSTFQVELYPISFLFRKQLAGI
jgi:hypothetical protein